MFTGIIEELGHVASFDSADEHARLRVACQRVLHDVEVGDSISVDGCCLTVTDHDASGFAADLMAETLRSTALRELATGDTVNLERAVQAQHRFGGHLVQGHVDAVGEVTARVERPGTVFLSVRTPNEVCAYLVPKGSVAVDGVSLTVVDVVHDVFRVGVIPHTLEATTLGSLGVGDAVNLEADVIAKYVARLLAAGAQTPYGGVSDHRLDEEALGDEAGEETSVRTSVPPVSTTAVHDHEERA